MNVTRDSTIIVDKRVDKNLESPKRVCYTDLNGSITPEAREQEFVKFLEEKGHFKREILEEIDNACRDYHELMSSGGPEPSYDKYLIHLLTLFGEGIKGQKQPTIQNLTKKFFKRDKSEILLPCAEGIIEAMTKAGYEIVIVSDTFDEFALGVAGLFKEGDNPIIHQVHATSYAVGKKGVYTKDILNFCHPPISKKRTFPNYRFQKFNIASEIFVGNRPEDFYEGADGGILVCDGNSAELLEGLGERSALKKLYDSKNLYIIDPESRNPNGLGRYVDSVRLKSEKGNRIIR